MFCPGQTQKNNMEPKFTLPTEDKVKDFHNLFSALSNKHRYNILRRLYESGAIDHEEEIKQSQIVLENATVGKSSISQHLKKMSQAGLLIIDKRGRESFLSLNSPTFHKLNKIFSL